MVNGRQPPLRNIFRRLGPQRSAQLPLKRMLHLSAWDHVGWVGGDEVLHPPRPALSLSHVSGIRILRPRSNAVEDIG